MTKLVQNRKNTLITYSVLNLLLCLLSLFLLFFKIFEVSFVLFVSTIFDFFYLFVIISFGRHKTADNKALDSGKNLVVFTILRSIIEVASLAISALGVFLMQSCYFILIVSVRRAINVCLRKDYKSRKI